MYAFLTIKTLYIAQFSISTPKIFLFFCELSRKFNNRVFRFIENLA